MGNTPSGCHLKCFETVAEPQRDSLRGSGKQPISTSQNAYICGCVKVVEVSKRYTARGAESRRANSRGFYVKKGRVSTRVCKAAFLEIHAISDGRLERALKAQADLGGSHNDRRGRHPPPNKTTEESLALVRGEHISSFPKYKSHYSRSDNLTRHYLSPKLSINRMYQLYKERCSGQGKNPVSGCTDRCSTKSSICLLEGMLTILNSCLHTHTHTHTHAHTHMHAHMHPRPYARTHTHAHMHPRQYARTHTCITHAHTHAHMHLRPHTCMHTCTHTHTCMHTCTHAHTHATHTHAHTRTRTHTCTQTRNTHVHTHAHTHTRICTCTPRTCSVSYSPTLIYYSPKTDTCKTCDTFKVKVDAEMKPNWPNYGGMRTTSV